MLRNHPSTGLKVIILALAALSTASCGGDDDDAAAASGGGGGGGGGGNSAPTISGTPGTSAVQGSAYAFQPTAADANSDPLMFAIQNKPTWANFSTSTGRLDGTPGQANIGTTNNIVISVSDGTATTALTAFNLAVTSIGTRSVTLSWNPPTTNTDGSPLADLQGFRIYYGTTAGGPYPTQVTISNPGIATYFLDNLAPNTYYFVATAYDTSGNESAFSPQVTKAL